MTPEEYEAAWSALPPPESNSELEATEIGDATGIWVGRDRNGRRHLLVQVDDRRDLSGQATHGLGIDTVEHRIAGRADALYVDLTCLDAAVAPTYAAVAADIVSAVLGVRLSDRPERITAAVREWRWFWGVDTSTMTTTESVGLFGELWFLNRWALPSVASIEAWQGSEGSRHDFQWPNQSVEIKTTARSAPIVHNIEHLDQLDDPATGDLYLYSLRIVRDSLAANSVRSLAHTAVTALRQQPSVRADLLQKLAQRGYNPAAGDATTQTYRVAEDALYRVSAGFPRLTRNSFGTGLPPGIQQVGYRLEMGACDPWRVQVKAEEWPP